MKQTMKQHSFTSQLKSLALVFGIALAFASCANEDVAQNPTNPNEDNDKNLTTFVAGGENKTRTSLNYNSGDFYWEKDDYIYVKDDNGVLQKSTNAPTSKVASFNYKVPGKFTASSSYKVYYLGKNSSGNSVSISTVQIQTAPDNTEHFGTAGDYGTATANKVTGKNQFEFVLEHQPAYLVFQPYTSNTILQSCYLTAIEVSSDDDIAEGYTVNSTTGALDASAVTKGSKIVLATRDWTSSSSSYYNGFPLTNNSASVTTNGAYMVIKPGTHTLKVRYWVKDVATNIQGTITKILPSTTYASNTYYDMKTNLDLKNYDGDKYYMWDAQQNYWAGHEWNSPNPWQPVLNNSSNSNYAQSNSDPRYKNEGGGSGRFDATQSCAGLPNVNEMYWYCEKGDCHWDADELWTTMGHLYKGGMWFKKKAYISGYNVNNSPGGDDRRNTNGLSITTNEIGRSLPSPSEANKYFYLPALGYYNSGKLYNVGEEGYYWSSSSPAARPGGESAYYLKFSTSSLGGLVQGSSYVFYTIREIGARVQAFE